MLQRRNQFNFSNSFFLTFEKSVIRKLAMLGSQASLLINIVIPEMECNASLS